MTHEETRARGRAQVAAVLAPARGDHRRMGVSHILEKRHCTDRRNAECGSMTNHGSVVSVARFVLESLEYRNLRVKSGEKCSLLCGWERLGGVMGPFSVTQCDTAAWYVHPPSHDETEKSHLVKT